MNGFSLKTKDNVFNAALEIGSVGILITNKEEDYTITLDGMDNRGIYFVWQKSLFAMGDSITIKYDEIDKSAVSEPIIVRDINDTKSEDERLLEAYNQLKQELIDEGLLQVE